MTLERFDGYKMCGGCKTVHPLCNFGKSNKTMDKLRTRCKMCRRKESMLLRDKYHEETKAKDRARVKKKKNIKIGSNKYIAQYKSNNAIRSGKIKRLPCEICGNLKSYGHHDDYNYPFDLRFLCGRHHRHWHLENGEGKNP